MSANLSIIQLKAKRAAEANFKKFLDGESSGFSELVESAWAKAKPAFLNHEDPHGHGVFDFYVPVKDYPGVTRSQVAAVLHTIDDFKDDASHIQIYKKNNQDDEPMFEISIVYGNIRDKQYDHLVEEHRAKKQRTEADVKEEEKEVKPEVKPEVKAE